MNRKGETTRTISLKLKVNKDTVKFLEEDAKLCKILLNYSSSVYYPKLIKDGKIEDRNLGYDEIVNLWKVGSKLSELWDKVLTENISAILQYCQGSYHTTESEVKVSSKEKKGDELLTGESAPPNFKRNIIILDDKSYKLNETPQHWLIFDYQFKKGEWHQFRLDGFSERNRKMLIEGLDNLSLQSEPDGTIRFNLVKAHPQVTITEGRNGWYLNIPLKKRVEIQKTDYDGCLGVDIGKVRFVQMAFYKPDNTKRFYNPDWNKDDESLAIFYDEIEHFRRVREIIRRNKQRRINRSSRLGHGINRKFATSSKDRDRDDGFQKSFNYKTAISIVRKAKSNNCFIAIESLNGLNSGGVIKHWQYSKFIQYLKDKAEEAGILVIEIGKFTGGTSQRCSICGYYPDKENGEESRLCQETFICPQCGYKANADYNAARNIAQIGWAIYLHRAGKPDRTLESKYRLYDSGGSRRLKGTNPKSNSLFDMDKSDMRDHDSVVNLTKASSGVSVDRQ